ncbi:MAG: hypothetical protein JW958_04055 [Candidatus Eisenbacteria bacterium]|nr:hypothetical protein [Candidatus Eisenbacteria bacterium]
MIDTHAHLHPCFRLEAFLDGAADHFRRAAEGNGLPAGATGCLLVADCEGRDSFSRWGGGGIDRSCRAWASAPTGEAVSVLARREDGARIALVAGGQVATREKVEVLVFGIREKPPAGESAERTVERALDAEALVVLPWGFGKWWGRRGRVIRRLLRSADPSRLFLGDVANRLSGKTEPLILREARRLGFRVLPGTDPFPFRSQERHAGRYGLILDGAPDPERPFASIRERLVRDGADFRVYGRRDRLVPFFVKQTAMQIRKVRR